MEGHKKQMESYDLPFEVSKDTIRIKVNNSISNVVNYADQHFVNGPHHDIVFSGRGSDSLIKTISCCEVIKRKLTNIDLYQMTKIRYQQNEKESPNKSISKVPCIDILLSKQQLDEHANGYQKISKTSDHISSQVHHVNPLERKQNPLERKQNPLKRKRLDTE